MNMIFWGIFYLVVTILLAYFFIREKKVMDTIKGLEEKILRKISIKSNEREIKIGNILTILAIIISIIFFILVDKTPDPLIKIKNIGIYGIFVINLFFYLFRQEQEFILLINLVMIFLGSLMFNIMDRNFYIYLGINILLSSVLIYLFRKESNEGITVDSLKQEARNNKIKLDPNKINEDTVQREVIRRSSMGRALSRISTTLLAILLVGTIQIFYVGNYVIPSGSMEPTILVKDRVFSNMVKYRFVDPKVGEVVSFKEPVNNQVMYTKRITGAPGTTLEIISGRINENDKVNEILNRPYEPEGLFYTNKIYIPKKGDKVKLDKIIAIEKLVGESEEGERIVGTNYIGYNNGEYYEELTGIEFLNRIKTNNNYKKIIANERDFDQQDPTKNVFYTFILKVEGRDEMVLPILDLRDNDSTFNKLLNGETVVLEDNYYMAMGDNTQNSYDSRYFGYVSQRRIKGELVVRWWPLNRIGLL